MIPTLPTCDRIRSIYKAYLRSLQGLWSAARHPDVSRDGKPRAIALPAYARTAFMRERLGSVTNLFPPHRWHDDCYSPRSSQALAVSVLGFLAETGQLDLLVSGAEKISFEIKKGRTHFDAVLYRQTDSAVATVECKYTEDGLNRCNYPTKGLCDGTWWSRPGLTLGCPMAKATSNRSYAKRYWAVASATFALPSSPPTEPMECPLMMGYQAFHNLAETERLGSGVVWILLYDNRNPFFADPFSGWVTILRPRVQRARFISWQELLRAARITDGRIETICKLHGF